MIAESDTDSDRRWASSGCRRSPVWNPGYPGPPTMTQTAKFTGHLDPTDGILEEPTEAYR